ncbi:MAG: hypothetical protein J5944_00975 [Lentisphaeria bacterium]|nr:hypothetical protein [Lentisphaeria bacterium]
MKRFAGDAAGSITLEYLMVMGMVIPVMVLWISLFSPDTGYTDTGWLLMQFFQRLLSGVALPIP